MNIAKKIGLSIYIFPTTYTVLFVVYVLLANTLLNVFCEKSVFWNETSYSCPDYFIFPFDGTPFIVVSIILFIVTLPLTFLTAKLTLNQFAKQEVYKRVITNILLIIPAINIAYLVYVFVYNNGVFWPL